MKRKIGLKPERQSLFVRDGATVEINGQSRKFGLFAFVTYVYRLITDNGKSDPRLGQLYDLVWRATHVWNPDNRPRSCDVDTQTAIRKWFNTTIANQFISFFTPPDEKGQEETAEQLAQRIVDGDYMVPDLDKFGNYRHEEVKDQNGISRSKLVMRPARKGDDVYEKALETLAYIAAASEQLPGLTTDIAWPLQWVDGDKWLPKRGRTRSKSLTALSLHEMFRAQRKQRVEGKIKEMKDGEFMLDASPAPPQQSAVPPSVMTDDDFANMLGLVEAAEQPADVEEIA